MSYAIRRALHASASCARFAHPTSIARAASNPLASTRLPTGKPQSTSALPDLSEPPIDPERKGAQALFSFMDSVADAHDYNNRSFETPALFAFKNQALMRPVDLKKDFHLKRHYERRSDVGPGREARHSDIFLQLGIDPRLEVDNINLLCDYMTRLGKIQPRSKTRLTHRSQRFIGKAIKRAKMMGFLPMLSNPSLRDKNIKR